jgi:hypothetical protein
MLWFPYPNERPSFRRTRVRTFRRLMDSRAGRRSARHERKIGSPIIYTKVAKNARNTLLALTLWPLLSLCEDQEQLVFRSPRSIQRTFSTQHTKRRVSSLQMMILVWFMSFRGRPVNHTTALIPPAFSACFTSFMASSSFRSSSFLKLMQLRPAFTLPSFLAFRSTE